MIVGGGTAGLVVASRLSEIPDLSIAVIEAGKLERNNPNVTNTTFFPGALGTSIDWAYSSTLQTFGGNRSLTYDAGKGLGATSLINGELGSEYE